ncbi:MAG: putative lipid II flippase FtsW [Candidatus Omnitrophota bacterium]|jgi:cell division protein FtsW
MISRDGRILFACVYVLVAIGIVMIYSATAVYAGQNYGSSSYYLVRQLFYITLGTFALFWAAARPIRFWRDHSRAIMLLGIALLMVVFVPGIGKTAGGARRWIHLGGINFQPAEFAKLAVCLYLADYLSRKRKQINLGSIGVFLPPMILVGLVCGLILLQPDLGSCAFIFVIVCILFFWAGIRMRYVFLAALVFVPVLYLLVIRVPYRLSRVTAYLNPWDDPQGNGFQMIQSFLAYGAGGIRGVGLGRSVQKLFYLPSGHNDFIFSIIAEELGLVGTLVVIGLFAAVFIAGLKIASRIQQDYEKILTVSLTLAIVLQALIHMLVATGLVPTKGLPLPFVSYGGTSLVFNLTVIGLVLGIDRQTPHGRKHK